MMGFNCATGPIRTIELLSGLTGTVTGQTSGGTSFIPGAGIMFTSYSAGGDEAFYYLDLPAANGNIVPLSVTLDTCLTVNEADTVLFVLTSCRGTE
jgi:hypothetical protein